MSERYTLFKINDVRERFRLDTPVPDDLKRSYNISPVQSAAVIVVRDGKRQLEQMKWGFIPQGAKDTNSVFRYKTFNARSEGIFAKPRWSEAIRHQRCLVPANGFYAWQKTADGKTPYYVHARDQELFAFAGIYSSWTDPTGKEQGMFSIVTVEANDDIRQITDRMPVMLSPDGEAAWLNPSASDVNNIYDLMRPYSAGQLAVNAVGADVNSVKIDKPNLVTPV